MKLQILSFGKLDEQMFKNVSQEYLKRISRYCDLEIIELKEETKYEIKKNQSINTQLLISHLTRLTNYKIYFLDVDAKLVSSLEFSKIIDENKNLETGKLSLVIGPSDGYDQELIKSYKKISFGKITLPHQLFRIILLEQIYRAFKIINQEKYHK